MYISWTKTILVKKKKLPLGGMKIGREKISAAPLIKKHIFEIVEFGRYKSAFSRVCIWYTSWNILFRTQRKVDFIVIGTFNYVQVVKSIPWTMIGCWPRNGHISIYIYIYIYIYGCFSNSVGLYWAILILSACWTLVGTAEQVSVVIAAYSAH